METIRQILENPIRFDNTICPLCFRDFGTREVFMKHFTLNHINYDTYCEVFGEPANDVLPPVMCFACCTVFKRVQDCHIHIALFHARFYLDIIRFQNGERNFLIDPAPPGNQAFVPTNQNCLSSYFTGNNVPAINHNGISLFSENGVISRTHFVYQNAKLTPSDVPPTPFVQPIASTTSTMSPVFQSTCNALPNKPLSPSGFPLSSFVSFVNLPTPSSSPFVSTTSSMNKLIQPGPFAQPKTPFTSQPLGPPHFLARSSQNVQQAPFGYSIAPLTSQNFVRRPINPAIPYMNRNVQQPPFRYSSAPLAHQPFVPTPNEPAVRRRRVAAPRPTKGNRKSSSSNIPKQNFRFYK